MRLSLSTQLSLARFSQIALMFSLGLSMYLLTTIPHNWWIFMTVLLMTAATEPGLVIKKSLSRGKGTLSGVIVFLPLIYVLQFNYRLIPIVYILTAIGVALPRPHRYDLSTFFATINVSLVTAYNFTTPLAEGPVEFAVNRALCTLLGIIICIGGDYILFRRFRYEHKVYFLIQREVCAMLEQNYLAILAMQPELHNSVISIERLREVLNQKFALVATCSESLNYSLSTSTLTRTKVQEFERVVWRLRQTIYALYYTRCILQDSGVTQQHAQYFCTLMQQAKTNWVGLNQD